MEDLLTKSGRKRCVKMVVPNLSVLPKIRDCCTKFAASYSSPLRHGRSAYPFALLRGTDMNEKAFFFEPSYTIFDRIGVLIEAIGDLSLR